MCVQNFYYIQLKYYKKFYITGDILYFNGV